LKWRNFRAEVQKPDNTFPNNKFNVDTVVNKTATLNDNPVDAKTHQPPKGQQTPKEEAR
jgi:hypothetical protein